MAVSECLWRLGFRQGVTTLVMLVLVLVLREISVGKDDLERTYLERLALNHALASQAETEQWEGEHAENSM